MHVVIIGAGPGNERFLTQEAKERLRTVDLVITTDRLFASLAHLNHNTVCKSLAAIPETVRDAKACQSVAILVSGDSGFFSYGKALPSLLREKLGGRPITIEHIPGISSMQLMCARLGVSHDDAKAISLHGREGDIVPFASYAPKIFVLTGGAVKAHDCVERLVVAGLGNVIVSVGSELGTASERLVTGPAHTLVDAIFSEPACMLVCNDAFRDPFEPLLDAAFIRGKTPMTKDAVRTLAITALGIRPKDTVFDIGAGTGSVSVCMARKAFEGRVFAVERDEDALALIEQNRLALGAFNMTIRKAEAPAGLDSLPMPDKAFIGGSGGRLEKIIQTLAARNPVIRMVVTAITLESLQRAIQAFEAHGFDPAVSCVNIATARTAGGYRMMQAENPVYIISGGYNAG